MSEIADVERVVRDFIEAFGRNDLPRLRSLLAADFTGHITTADGGTRSVGADDYVAAVDQMDVPSADLRLDIPDITRVDRGLILVLVEVHASRGNRVLHNFSGQLLRVEGGLLRELWMVDAKPAESDSFWAS